MISISGSFRAWDDRRLGLGQAVDQHFARTKPLRELAPLTHRHTSREANLQGLEKLPLRDPVRQGLSRWVDHQVSRRVQRSHKPCNCHGSDCGHQYGKSGVVRSIKIFGMVIACPLKCGSITTTSPVSGKGLIRQYLSTEGKALKTCTLNARPDASCLTHYFDLFPGNELDVKNAAVQS
jgi:hypothetical protein